MKKMICVAVLLSFISLTANGARGSFKETVLGEEKVAKAAKGIEIKTKVTLPQQGVSGLCDAALSISYTQMNDRVRIRREVANDACPSSDGVYTLRIRTLSEDGEARTRTFEESWELDNQSKDKSQKFYSMDGDVRLIWARVKTSRKTRCMCRIPGSATDGLEVGESTE